MKKLIFLVLIICAPSLFAIEFSLDPGSQTDSVHFRSSAKLEFIHGQTNDLFGWFSFDPENLLAPALGELRVDLRTLKTAIETRDEHMREKHLHTDKFPYAYFSLDSIIFDSDHLNLKETIDGQAFGRFYIHGVKRAIVGSLEVMITEHEFSARKVTVNVQFAILLDEFKIDRPKALFLKLAEKIELELNFTGVESEESTRLTLPDWPLLP